MNGPRGLRRGDSAVGIFHKVELKEIAKLDFVLDEREEFVKKYQRDVIMQSMAMELIAYF